jgi:hypothetical protein
LLTAGLLCGCGGGGGNETADGGNSDALASSEGGGSKDGGKGKSDSGSKDGGTKDGGTKDGGTENGDSSSNEGGKEKGDSGSNEGGSCTPTTAGANGQAVTISSGTTYADGGNSCVLAPNVTADLTLSASQCKIYDAPGGLSVGGSASPTLTIGPGVTVAFGRGTMFYVGSDAAGAGGLVVQGSACAPVVFTTDVAVAPAAGDWGQVALESQTLPTSSVSNLIVQYAGANVIYGFALASSLLVSDVQVPLSNVTLSNNAATGFWFSGLHAGPSPASSGTLTVTDWPTTSDPFIIDCDAAGLLSSVHLSTRSAPNGYVHLTSDPIDVSEHWPSISPLYYALGLLNDSSQVKIGNSGGADTVTLTIDAPNTLRLGNGFVIDVDEGALGALQVNGSGSSPILFTSLTGVPAPGIWNGMQFDYAAGAPPSSISNVTIDSAGGFGINCTAGAVQGAILLEDLGVNGSCVSAPTLTDITFTSLPSGAYGFLATNVSPATATALASTDGNVFPSSSQGVYNGTACSQCN